MISTHILDISLGTPASNVEVALEKENGSSWSLVGREKTNNDGRIAFQCPQEPGLFRLTFHIDSYFQKNNIEPFFTIAPVIFKISNTKRKYHIPLLLSPYGYSTYRGS